MTKENTMDEPEDWNPEELHEFLEWAPKELARIGKEWQRIAKSAERTNHPDADLIRRKADAVAHHLEALKLNINFVTSLPVDADGLLLTEDLDLLEAYEKFNEGEHDG